MRSNGRSLTLTKTVIPAHVDGWAHFTEGIADVVSAFGDAGLAGVLALAPLGECIIPTV